MMMFLLEMAEAHILVRISTVVLMKLKSITTPAHRPRSPGTTAAADQSDIGSLMNARVRRPMTQPETVYRELSRPGQGELLRSATAQRQAPCGTTASRENGTTRWTLTQTMIT